MLVPRARVRTEGDFLKRSSARSVPSRIVPRSRLGTSIPRVERPAMRSMRTDSARRASARSSWRFTTCETLTPGAGCSSKTVMTGPGLIPAIVPSTPNSSQRLRIISPWRTSSASSTFLSSSPICSRLTGGRVEDPGAASPTKGRARCGGAAGRSGFVGPAAGRRTTAGLADRSSKPA